MDTYTPPTVFLSYSHTDKKIVDDIDRDFANIGITLRRDIRDLPYRSSIKEFMNEIGKSNFVLMIISESYLKSEWCMYEVTELLNTHEFEKRILPIILENLLIFKWEDKKVYYDYWKRSADEAERIKKEDPNEESVKRAKRYSNISNNLDVFFDRLSDLKVLQLSDLQQQMYLPILKTIGFDEVYVWEELSKTSEIKDQQEKELAIEELIEKYPNNKYVLLQRAVVAEDFGDFTKARIYYERLIKSNPQFYQAKFVLGRMLAKHFSQYKEALELYDECIKQNSKFGEAYTEAAIIYQLDLNDKEKAKDYYARAIKNDPDNSRPYFGLATLLESSFQDYENASVFYQKTIMMDPDNYDAVLHFASLQYEQFSKKDEAREIFEELIAYFPEREEAFVKLADLLVEEDKIKEAIQKYEKAIQLNPNNNFTYLSLGSSYAEINDLKNAKKAFDRSKKIDPNNPYLYICLTYYFIDIDNEEEAKKSYLKAIKLDPQTINSDLNKRFKVSQ